MTKRDNVAYADRRCELLQLSLPELGIFLWNEFKHRVESAYSINNIWKHHMNAFNSPYWTHCRLVSRERQPYTLVRGIGSFTVVSLEGMTERYEGQQL